MFLLVILFTLSLAVNEYCKDAACSSCTDGLLYNSTACLKTCPAGYLINSTTKSCILSSSTTLFDLNFADFSNTTAFNINNFSTPSNQRFNSGPSSPVPTGDRGFYFFNNSSLVSKTTGIPGPDFSLMFFIKPINNGIIFEVFDGNILFIQIKLINNIEIIASWNTSSTNTSEYIIQIACMSFT